MFHRLFANKSFTTVTNTDTSFYLLLGKQRKSFWQAGSSSCEGCWWLVVMVGGLDGCSGV